MQSSAPAVRVDDVSFRYSRFRGRKQCALSHVSFALRPGITALLGPNGAGKTTLIRLLTTLASPSSGRIYFGGKTIDSSARLEQVRRTIGYMPQSFDMMEGETVRTNIEYAAWARGIANKQCSRCADNAINRFGLHDYAMRKVQQLSGGVRQRVGLACTTVHNPRLLVLDEPTAGIDPLQRKTFKHILSDYGRHATVLLSTHMIEEMEGVASNVLVLNNGRLIFDGSIEDFEQCSPAKLGDSTNLDSASLEDCYESVLRCASDDRPLKGSMSHG